MNVNLNNNLQVRGFLTKECTLSYYQNSKNEKTAIAKFTLAVRDSSNKDNVEFLPFTVFGKQAETLAAYTVKGSQLLVSASVRTNSFTKKKGKIEETVYQLQLICNGYEFLGNPKSWYEGRANIPEDIPSEE